MHSVFFDANYGDDIVLRAQNLSIGYNNKGRINTVASKINFSLKKGQLIGLVGANGSGKSTLLRTLSHVQPALGGFIALDKKLINEYAPLELAKRLSLVLTDKTISKNLTVKELIALGRQPYTNWIGHLTNKDKAIINNAIELCKINKIKDEKCYELSDGQFQKVMIARALAQDTDLILLDEPTTHLDVHHQAYVLKLLQELTQTTQKTIFFATHEIDLAIQLCDSIIAITNYDVIFDTPKNLIKNETFDALFPEDVIVFDDRSESFKIKK